MESEEGVQLKIYNDFNPTHAKDPFLSKMLRERLIDKFNSGLDATIERISTLSPLMIHHFGEYVELLVEARNVFAQGHFYASVAMCGIASERITKDIINRVIYVKTGENTATLPPEEALEKLERVDSFSLVNFLYKCSVINKAALNASLEIIKLRNVYAHGGGKSPKEDALKAITQLQIVVDETMSVLKNYVIENGRLVPKKQEP